MLGYVTYKPVDERTPDAQYKGLLLEILNRGQWYKNAMGKEEDPALTIFGPTLIYDLANGAPIITERDVVTLGRYGRSILTQALGEMTAFINGARTVAELEAFGCYWWKNWITPEKTAKRGLAEGDLGPGSYGAAWTAFPTQDGGAMNQIQAMIAQIRYRPELRSHRISNWVPERVYRLPGKTQGVVVVPCHGNVHIRINVDTGGLTLIHTQNSADVPVGLPANLIGYTAFALMVAQVTGYRAEQLVFTLADAHIYESQLTHVEKLLTAADGILPTMTIITPRKEMEEFRPADFQISDYYPTGPRMIIPTAGGKKKEGN